MKYFQMEKGIIKDKIKAKKYYTENYNRINKNIGSTIFSIFLIKKKKKSIFFLLFLKFFKI